MAQIFPFAAYRYSARAGSIDNLVTQPYDKITPAMRERYLGLSPYNLVRIILGEGTSADSTSNNVYTRAQRYFSDWIAGKILDQDEEPGVYVYTQEFALPDSNEKLTRKGFIALGAVEDYDAKIVHRHEQTLSGPKKDRLELLRHTRAHFGQIFMLYPDRELAIDKLLDQSTPSAPTSEVTDEYQTVHRLWRLADTVTIERLQQMMAAKKLLIADGHHRYETALAFRNENPDLPAAKNVMMTFVNMHSPGLKILATHRVIKSVPNFDANHLILATNAKPVTSIDELKQIFQTPAPDRIRIGIALSGGLYLIDRERQAGELDVPVLHQEILAKVLNIDDEAVRDESYIQYVRGIDAAVEEIAKEQAQAVFLLEPTTIDQVADIAFSGGVMPQKSTDFYPKLLSGLTIYKL